MSEHRRVRKKVQHREATLYLEQHPPQEASGCLTEGTDCTGKQSKAWSDLTLGNLEQRYVKVSQLFPKNNKLNSLS